MFKITKYMILFSFIHILGSSLNGLEFIIKTKQTLNAPKTVEKGPVLHPLRSKPYQKKTYLT